MSSTIESNGISDLRESLKADRLYRSLGEIESLVRAFEECLLPRIEWTHRAHLTVAFWYLFHRSGNEAAMLVRNGIKRYNAANGVAMTREGGYHETITLFWICAVSKFLIFAEPGRSVVELANEIIERFDNPRLPFEHYSRERLMSWEARTSWIEPDLKPLD